MMTTTTTMTVTSRYRRRRCLLFFVGALLAVAVELVAGQDACLTSLNSLALREANVATTQVERTYTLCAGTEFVVGTLDYDRQIQNGQEMIPLRPNLRIKCGDTGSRSERCLVKGGDVHVDGTRYFGLSSSQNNDLPLSNVVVEGVTFQGAAMHAAWLSRPGNVTFRDCVFAGHRGSLPVLMDHFDPGNPRSELRVDFEGCSFTGNDANGGPAVTAVTAGQTRPRAPQPAVIASRGGQNRLVVDRCLFEGNDYVTNNTMPRTSSFLVESTGPLTMTSNCFVGNRVALSPVAAYGRHDRIFASNYGNASAGEACPFASRFEAAAQYEGSAPSCLDYDAATCLAGVFGGDAGIAGQPATPAPAKSPTKSPTKAPTKAPTDAPTNLPATKPPTNLPATEMPSGTAMASAAATPGPATTTPSDPPNAFDESPDLPPQTKEPEPSMEAPTAAPASGGGGGGGDIVSAGSTRRHRFGVVATLSALLLLLGPVAM